MFGTFAESVVDAWRAGDASTVTIEGGERLQAALDAGHGVLLWSAHLGNWELAAAALARGGFDVSALARAHADPGVERFFDSRPRPPGGGSCSSPCGTTPPHPGRICPGRICPGRIWESGRDRARAGGETVRPRPRVQRRARAPERARAPQAVSSRGRDHRDRR